MILVLALASVLVVFLLSVTFVLLIIGPTLLLRPRRRRPEFYRSLGYPLTPREGGMEYEEINISVAEGLSLSTWIIKAAQPAKGTVLYLHGVADCKIDGIRVAEVLHRNHFNVCLFDARRHGDSGGDYCTYGFFEKHDVIRIIDYLQSRTDIPAGRIGVFGTSMGAAVAIQAAVIDPRIAAVVAENSFATLRTIFDDYQRRMIKVPFHYLRNIVIKRSEIIAGFKASDVSPLDAVQNLRIPILYIYGTLDNLIDHHYSLMLFDRTAGPREIFPIEHASHNNTWLIAGKVYEQRILDFLGRNL